MKILDCTLRDGGYYTNWDFDKKLVESYCKTMESLPIEYVEVGYRSVTLYGYLGEYFYCPDFVLKDLKQMMPSKKLAVLLNEKDVKISAINNLLDPCMEYLSLIRIAVDPRNFKRAIPLAKEIRKRYNFEIAFNVMYMSSWVDNNDFLTECSELEGIVDYFYMVDSYGGIFQQDVSGIIKLVRENTNVKLGFHGHNNLEMALANTITAIDEGCELVDMTITGMGRGAGNLKTELFLTYLNSKGEIDINFDVLSRTVSFFEDLKKQYNWGTSLPYMFSGAYSLPQKQVMEWVGLNRYTLSSILNALNNKKNTLIDNFKLELFESKLETFENAVIIGGGATSVQHKDAVIKFIGQEANSCLIHAGIKNIGNYSKNVSCIQFYTLLGVESEDFWGNLDLSSEKNKCIYPPFPRKMGTTIPDSVRSFCYELDSISFTNASFDSPLVIALQLAMNLDAKRVFLVGFDGYDTLIDKDQFVLANENQSIIDDFKGLDGVEIISVTPTKYKRIKTQSIYSFI